MLEDEIFAYLDPARERSYRDYQYHKKRLDDAITPVQEARKIIKGTCMAFDAAQERLRREEQLRLEAEARKRADEQALAEALAAEQSGDKELAEQIIEEPVYVPPVTVARTAPAPSRLSAGRSVWAAEVTSLMALVKAVAEGKQPISLLEPNMPVLNGLARSLKSTWVCPGVRAVEKKV